MEVKLHHMVEKDRKKPEGSSSAAVQYPMDVELQYIDNAG